MASYLYTASIIKDTSTAIGIDVTQNNTDKADFENNRKSQATKVSSVDVAETTFMSDESYTAFSARITGGLTWADVKYTETGAFNNYTLYLLL